MGTMLRCSSWRSCRLASRVFPIYTGTNEVGKVFTLMGYGTYGTGAAGEVFDPDDQKREGENIFDATGATIGCDRYAIGVRL